LSTDDECGETTFSPHSMTNRSFGQNECGGFDLRFSVAANAFSEYQIQNRTRTQIAGVPLVLTFAKEPAEE
jgi:hypothetical protein